LHDVAHPTAPVLIMRLRPPENRYKGRSRHDQPASATEIFPAPYPETSTLRSTRGAVRTGAAVGGAVTGGRVEPGSGLPPGAGEG
jgi:hypothetical protein